MNNDDELPEKFSEDPEEQLRIENEILRLKLKAELGGEIETIEGTENLPPEIENLFLKNILSFEHQFESIEPTTIYQIVQQPKFASLTSLDEAEIETALDKITKLLLQFNIAVDYRGDYSAKEKYRFIVEDLFNHETRMVQIEGMVTHYSYEEFHPNHNLDIEEQTKEFITDWFEMNIEENSFVLANEILTDKQQLVPKAEVLKKFVNIFASYEAFENANYIIEDVQHQLDTEQETGLGHVEGLVSFTAILENGEKINVQESFKLYMQLEFGTWSVFFFYWPGINWE